MKRLLTLAALAVLLISTAAVAQQEGETAAGTKPTLTFAPVLADAPQAAVYVDTGFFREAEARGDEVSLVIEGEHVATFVRTESGWALRPQQKAVRTIPQQSIDIRPSGIRFWITFEDTDVPPDGIDEMLLHAQLEGLTEAGSQQLLPELTDAEVRANMTAQQLAGLRTVVCNLFEVARAKDPDLTGEADAEPEKGICQ